MKYIFVFTLFIYSFSVGQSPIIYGCPKIMITAPTDTILLSAGVQFGSGHHMGSASWSKLSGPGSTTISNNTIYNYAIARGLQVGTYIFQVSITDEASNTTTKNDTIVVFTKTAGAKYPIMYTSGNLNIDPSITSPALKHGDTLDIVGGPIPAINLNDIIGAIGDSVHIRFFGTKFTSLSFNGGNMNNCQYLTIEDLSFKNWYGTFGIVARTWGIHFKRLRSVNDSAVRFPDQSLIEFYDQGNNDTANSKFKGSRYQTIFGITISNSYFYGYKNALAGVIGYGQETAKSICTDFLFYKDTMIRNDNSAGTETCWLSGTGFNFSVINCVFDSLGFNTGGGGAHQAYWNHWGDGLYQGNTTTHQYAQALRLVPMQWYGFPGYKGALDMYNNIDAHHRSYSTMETSHNNVGNRVADLNAGFCQTHYYYNTTYETKIDSYLAPYFGMGMDCFCDSIYMWDCAIISPENDSPYHPSLRGGYTVSYPNGPKNAIDTGNNRQFQWAVQAGFDSINYRLIKGSSLINAGKGARTTPIDHDGVDRGGHPDIGGRQYYHAGWWFLTKKLK